jgi:alpha-tubulin suppressor-like RCC1 family protein
MEEINVKQHLHFPILLVLIVGTWQTSCHLKPAVEGEDGASIVATVPTLVPETRILRRLLQLTSDSNVLSNINHVTFNFSVINTQAEDRTPAFECKLDSNPWQICVAPLEIDSLVDGDHTFSLRTTHLPELAQLSDEVHWFVDQTSPVIEFTAGPANETSNLTETFVYTVADISEFTKIECSVDNDAFYPCQSPFLVAVATYHLHKLIVRALDRAGNLGKSAPYYWTVSEAGQVTGGGGSGAANSSLAFSSTPATSTQNNFAKFAFAVDLTEAPNVMYFECRLDEETWSLCTSPVSLTNVAEGVHNFNVKVVRNDASTATINKAWSVDHSPPYLNIYFGPPGIIQSSNVYFLFTVKDSSGIFSLKCTTDSLPPTDCASPYALSNLSIGSHSLVISATDNAGNSITSSPFSWIVAPIIETSEALEISDAFDFEGTTPQFTIKSGKSLSTNVQVIWGLQFLSSTTSEDLSPLNGNFNIVSGDNNHSVSVSLLADNIDELTENYKLVLSDTMGATSWISAGKGYIFDSLHQTTKISAGNERTCAIDEGLLKCWGYNSDGYLGTVNTESAITPKVITSITSPIDVSVGQNHNCVVIQGGTAYCWGLNSSGQLGTATFTNSQAPKLVQTLTNTVKIVTGMSHTCALLSDNTMRCWGNNDFGQIGNNLVGAQIYPVSPANLTGVTDITVGFYHTCALLDTGAVKCWGENSYGQLGINQSGDLAAPGSSPVGFSTNVVAIAAGDYHTCLLKNNGEMYCWGRNSEGQIGDGTTTNRFAPQKISSLGSIKKMATGGRHTCAITVSDHTFCWGSNENGQIGRGTTTTFYLTAKELVNLSSPTSLSLGANHSCALINDGSVECWGNSFNGATGSKQNFTILEPKLVRGFYGPAQAISKGFNSNHVCGILGNRIKCAGKNNFGQLGDGTTTDNESAAIVINLGSGNPTKVVTGKSHTCALLATGEVKCWGSNEFGQLGTGVFTDSPLPALVSSLILPAMDISAGENHNCAILNDQSVYCWGLNTNGELGDNSYENQPQPVEIPFLSKTAVKVASGRQSNCIIDTNSSLHCWGNNDTGLLGAGNINLITIDVVPANLSANVDMVDIGGQHACALKTDGTIYCWGSNSYGQIGDNTTTQRLTPTIVNTKYLFSELSLGEADSCARTSSGEMYCWGNNHSSQPLIGNQSGPVRLLVPYHVGGLDGPVSKINASGNFICGLLNTGHIQCWGGSITNAQLNDLIPQKVISGAIAPQISIADVTINEGAAAVFTVTTNKLSSLPITFDWSTSDGSALAGQDYVASSGTGTIDPNQSSTMISVPSIDDTTPRPNFNFNLRISNIRNTFNTETGASAVILDNDPYKVDVTGWFALPRNTCAGAFQVKLLDRNGTLRNANKNIDINLGGNGGGVYYNDPDCNNAITTITFQSGDSSKLFYFRDTVTESLVLSFSSTEFLTVTYPLTIASVSNPTQLTFMGERYVPLQTCLPMYLHMVDNSNNTSVANATTTVNLASTSTIKILSDSPLN